MWKPGTSPTVHKSDRNEPGQARCKLCSGLFLIRAEQVRIQLSAQYYRIDLTMRSSECIVTHVNTRKPTLSTSEIRREAVILSAMEVFAAKGYLGTPVTDVARHAEISTAYVFKIFPTKEALFVAALDRCFALIVAALAEGARESKEETAEELLFAMGGAYAALIADRKLLLLQIHAQSVTAVPEIGKAFSRGLESVVSYAKKRSKASDEQVQRFVAYGQLCHLITTAGLDSNEAAWARILTHGIRHP